MKIDMHSHVIDADLHITPEGKASITAFPLDTLNIRPEDHWEKSAKYTDYTVVFGGKFSGCGWMVPDEYVANYVKRHPDTLIGFLSVDPSAENVADVIEHGVFDLGMKGIKTSTFYSNTSLDDPKFDMVFKLADHYHLPIIFHASPAFPQQCFTRYASLAPFEQRALEYPNVKMVIAHLGYPHDMECMHIVRRYPNLFVDVSSLAAYPWGTWDTMMKYYEWGVFDKILIGSDFKFATYPDTYNFIKHLNDITAGTHLPKFAEKDLMNLLERDTLELLGVEHKAK